MASKILAMVCRQLPDDWFNRYKLRPVLMETFVESARGMILVDSENREKLLNEHQSIVDSISEGDSEKSIKAMREHLDTINRTMEKLHK